MRKKLILLVALALALTVMLLLRGKGKHRAEGDEADTPQQAVQKTVRLQPGQPLLLTI